MLQFSTCDSISLVLHPRSFRGVIFYGQNIDQNYPKSFRICFLRPQNPFPYGFPWANCGNPMPQRKSCFQKFGFALERPANGPKSGLLLKMGQKFQ